MSANPNQRGRVSARRAPELREAFGLKLVPLRGLLEMADIKVLTQSG
jgi:hypothetical protein